MTLSKEISAEPPPAPPPLGGRLQTWARTAVGYKLPVLLTSVLLLIVLVWATPSSFLSYSQLSESQMRLLANRPLASHRDSDPLQAHLRLEPSASPTNDPVHETRDSAVRVPATPPAGDPVWQSQPPSEDSGIPPSTRQDLTGLGLGSPTLVPTAQPTDSDPKSKEESPSNVTVVDATPVVAPTPAVQQEHPQEQQQPPLEAQKEEEEKYVMPGLSFVVGTGNQLIEYKSALVIARTLNRTLCLSPFFTGPARHFGYLGDRHAGLLMEERYDIPELSKFVRVASMAECMKKCERKIDVHWRLRKMSKAPAWDLWFSDWPRWSLDFDRNAPKWKSTAEVAAFLGSFNEGPRCVGLGGLFPGLTWRGVLYAPSAFMHHSPSIVKAVDLLQSRAFGSPARPYVSVHWRFEESNCREYTKGLCFARCADGAVIANAQRSETWATMDVEGPIPFARSGFSAALLVKEDVAAAIHQLAARHGARDVYLSSDGWLRGPKSIDILKWVVENLREKGVNVAGLWQIFGLPNFADGGYVLSDNVGALFGMERKQKASNQMIALVEQEVCGRSAAFIGSGQSTWSAAVAETREANRCRENLSREMRDVDHSISDAEADNRVIETLLTIQYSPFPTCRIRANDSAVEQPDGWLDYLACEGQLLAGVGKCKKIST